MLVIYVEGGPIKATNIMAVSIEEVSASIVREYLSRKVSYQTRVGEGAQCRSPFTNL